MKNQLSFWWSCLFISDSMFLSSFFNIFSLSVQLLLCLFPYYGSFFYFASILFLRLGKFSSATLLKYFLCLWSGSFHYIYDSQVWSFYIVPEFLHAPFLGFFRLTFSLTEWSNSSTLPLEPGILSPTWSNLLVKVSSELLVRLPEFYISSFISVWLFLRESLY